MTQRDWITSPEEWGEFGLRANWWFNDLVTEVRRIDTANTALTDGTSGITFAPNVANLGAGFRGAKVTIDASGRIHARGVINNNSGGIIAAGTALIQMPASYRPANTEISQGVTALSGGVIRADMNNVGQIYLQVGWAIGDFLAFNFLYDAT